MFSLESFWLVLGVLAFITAFVNLYLLFRGKRNSWPWLVFLSLSLGLLTLVAQIQMINSWVAKNDWAAMLDVVPTLSTSSLIAVLAGLFLNGLAVILGRKQ